MKKGEISNPASHSLFDFGTIAHDYDRWYLTPEGQNHDRIQKQDVLELLPPAQPYERLLDVGCGTGHWSRFFRSLGYTVTGVDISEEMVEVAKSYHTPGCGYQVADACDFPFDDDTFDVVAAMAMLGFVSDAFQVLKEMTRCAKGEGVILIGTLNRLAEINQERLTEGREPYVSGRFFSEKELHDFLCRFGEVRIVNSRSEARKTGEKALIVAEVRT